MEVGNSGMFRPEMLEPMGLPPDVRVIAWGLSLERPTMILYGIDNIRDLFGHKVRGTNGWMGGWINGRDGVDGRNDGWIYGWWIAAWWQLGETKRCGNEEME
jgi:hypothetical protein